MAAPQHNYPYPYNPHLARAALFNHNDPQFTSIIANCGSDGGDDDEVLPRALPPAGHWNQEAQGTNIANNSDLDAAAGDQNTPPTSPVESASVPGAGATHEAANQTLTDDVAGTTAHSVPASEPTGEAVADMDVPQEAISLRPLLSESQPEAGSSAATSTSHTGHTSPIVDMPRPTNGSDTVHETASTKTSISSGITSDASTSRRRRKGAATPDRQPRRSIRESARRTAQVLHDLLVPKSRRGRKTTAAATSGGPSASTTTHGPSAPTQAIVTAPTSSKSKVNNLSESEKDAKTGLSAKASGKRRRVEPDDEEEDASDSGEASPSKKARRVKNLRNRSTPARFDVPREEPTSPNPFLVTPARKRAFTDDEENEAGQSKRARPDLDGESLATPRTPSPGPARTSPATEQPRRSWSVQAQPSLPIVHTPQESTGLPPPTTLNAPLPEFVVVLTEMPPQPLVPALPPVPAQPGPLRRTYAKIFIRAGPSHQ